MTSHDRMPVSVQSKLAKFQRKDYRDGYMQTAIRSGIGYRIRAMRAKLGLSQADLAQAAEKQQSTIARLESQEYGRVSVQTLLDLASAMDVALSIEFVSYPTFLARTEGMSSSALQPDTIQESIIAADRQIDKLRPTTVALSTTTRGPIVATAAQDHRTASAVSFEIKPISGSRISSYAAFGRV